MGTFLFAAFISSLTLFSFPEKWRDDEDSKFGCALIRGPKSDSLYSLELTFIVLGRPSTDLREDLRTEDVAKLPMIGDVNLFFNRTADEDCNDILEVECEVMIAGELFNRCVLLSG